MGTYMLCIDWKHSRKFQETSASICLSLCEPAVAGCWKKQEINFDYGYLYSSIDFMVDVY